MRKKVRGKIIKRKKYRTIETEQNISQKKKTSIVIWAPTGAPFTFKRYYYYSINNNKNKEYKKSSNSNNKNSKNIYGV